VLTREKNGHGKTPAQAILEWNGLMASFPARGDTTGILTAWLTLVAKYGVTGRFGLRHEDCRGHGGAPHSNVAVV
jgi:hypothetical protein